MTTSKGLIRAISVSEKKGVPKCNVPQARFTAGHGIIGDAHAGHGKRQVSLLAYESIRKMTDSVDEFRPGDFAENVTTELVDLRTLREGDRLRIGRDVELEVTQLGKRCRRRCAVFERAGNCIMPREGVFARVCRSGVAKPGDEIEAIYDQSRNSDDQ